MEHISPLFVAKTNQKQITINLTKIKFCFANCLFNFKLFILSILPGVAGGVRSFKVYCQHYPNINHI